MSRRRRDFLKAAALSSCSWPAFLLPSQKHDECDEMLRQTRRRFQEGLAEERAILFRQLISRYGSGVLDLVRKVTIEDARRRLRESSLPKRDLEAVLEILWKPSAGLLDFRVEEKGPGLLKLRVTECLFAAAMRKHAAADIGLAFYCAYDYGFCEGLNPKIVFTRTKTLMGGDAFCDHTYMLKSS